MRTDNLVTIEKRRLAALIELLKTARTAVLRNPRRFDYPPFDGYSLAAQIDQAIAETCAPASEVRS